MRKDIRQGERRKKTGEAKGFEKTMKKHKITRLKSIDNLSV